MLFLKYLSLSATLFSIVVLGSPSVIPRADPVNISNPPTRDAVCAVQSIPAIEIIEALKHAHGWVQTGTRGGHNNVYPREFHNREGISFSSECDGVTLWEYPVLLGVGKNPWVPGKNTKTKSEVRVIFASISASDAIFCGVIEKDAQKVYQVCPI